MFSTLKQLFLRDATNHPSSAFSPPLFMLGNNSFGPFQVDHGRRTYSRRFNALTFVLCQRQIGVSLGLPLDKCTYVLTSQSTLVRIPSNRFN